MELKHDNLCNLIKFFLFGLDSKQGGRFVRLVHDDPKQDDIIVDFDDIFRARKTILRVTEDNDILKEFNQFWKHHLGKLECNKHTEHGAGG